MRLGARLGPQLGEQLSTGCRAGEGLEPSFMLFFNGDYLYFVYSQFLCGPTVAGPQGHRVPYAKKNLRVGSCVVTCLWSMAVREGWSLLS